jgi:UDP-N-acetylglucosamine 4,6-dehydratase
MTSALVTGGTGSFGQAFLRRVLPLGWTVRVLSRDELKQAEQRENTVGDVRWLLGDVRDYDRVLWAARGCDLIVHAAALKRVDACERDPFEALETNAVGSRNVARAAVDSGVPKAILLSSDKAVHPVNMYGATKFCAEKLWLCANVYGGCFSAVRYGNVRGSRGSVVERWKNGPVSLTDPLATRFWLEVDQAVDLVLTAAERMQGGELFIPKVNASRIADLLPAGAVPEITGLGLGEKLHEVLISEEEVVRTFDCGDHYVVAEEEPSWSVGRVLPGFRYSSEAASA